jgi:uncharacterized membrane protein YfcA
MLLAYSILLVSHTLVLLLVWHHTIGILVPVYTLVLQLPIKHAITLTSVTVLGGAVANNLLNYSKRHPLHPSRHVVDWDLILMLEPMTIAGAMSGAVINEFLSDVMVVLLLLVLLLFTAYKTLTKAVDLYHKETQLIMEAKRASTEEGQNLINNGSDNNNNKSTSVAYGAAADIGSATMTETTTSKEEAAHQIWLDIVKLSSLFVIVTVINLLKGGLESSGRHRVQLNLFESCGNACFWVSNAVIVLIILAFVVHTRTSLLKRVQSGGPVISDIAWDEHNTIQYPLYAIAAGLVAGMFGIGKSSSVRQRRRLLSLWAISQPFSVNVCGLVRRWNHQGPSHASPGCTSRCSFGDFCVYDPLYQFHGYPQLHGVWTFDAGLRHCLSFDWICVYSCGTVRYDTTYTTLSTAFVRCLFYWVCGCLVGHLYDC